MRITKKPRESLGGRRNPIARLLRALSELIGRAWGLAGRAGRNGGHVAVGLPRTWGNLRSGAEDTVTSLQKMPDSELGLLTAASVGLAAGLGLAGAPRVVSLAGFACASFLGFAMLSRPGHQKHDHARA